MRAFASFASSECQLDLNVSFAGSKGHFPPAFSRKHVCHWKFECYTAPENKDGSL